MQCDFMNTGFLVSRYAHSHLCTSAIVPSTKCVQLLLQVHKTVMSTQDDPGPAALRLHSTCGQ